MPKFLGCLIGLFMFSATAWGVDPDEQAKPDIEHIVEVLQANQAAIKTIDISGVQTFYKRENKQAPYGELIPAQPDNWFRVVLGGKGRFRFEQEYRDAESSKPQRFVRARGPQGYTTFDRTKKTERRRYCNAYCRWLEYEGQLKMLQSYLKQGIEYQLDYSDELVVIKFLFDQSEHHFYFDTDKDFFIGKSERFTKGKIKMRSQFTPLEQGGAWIMSEMHRQHFQYEGETPIIYVDIKAVIQETRVNGDDVPEGLFVVDKEVDGEYIWAQWMKDYKLSMGEYIQFRSALQRELPTKAKSLQMGHFAGLDQTGVAMRVSFTNLKDVKRFLDETPNFSGMKVISVDELDHGFWEYYPSIELEKKYDWWRPKHAFDVDYGKWMSHKKLPAADIYHGYMMRG